MKLSSDSCARTTDAVPSDSRQIAGSRRGPAVGGGSSSPSSASRAGSARRRPTTAARAPTAHAPARATIAAGTPPACTATGSSRAAIAPPSGVDMCRRPRAKPRWVGPNQATTARPLAALALEPNAPAATRQAPSPPAVSVSEASSRAPAAPVRPIPMTARSPMRSARAPQASSVTMMPTVDAASSAPMPARERSY